MRWRGPTPGTVGGTKPWLGGTANPCSQQLVRVEATRAQKTKHGGGRGAKKDDGKAYNAPSSRSTFLQLTRNIEYSGPG